MTLKYLQGYPPELQAQVRGLIDAGRLAQVVAQRHPQPHAVRTERALYDYVSELKSRHMRSAPPLAKVPDNAGPLNTQRLMHQALSLMGDASPAYLQHFMAHVDALLALEQLGPQPTPARKDGTRASRHS